MTVHLARIIESLLLPPGILLLLIATGLLLVRARPRLGFILATSSLLSLYLLSIPAVAHSLIGLLEERYPPLTELQLDRSGAARAIVVLAGGRKANAPEYGGDTVSHLSLTRLRYAAWLHRRTGLPIITSGGIVLTDSRKSEAELMAEVLQEAFGIERVITENASRNTRENARNVRQILEQQGLAPVYLVTHAFHMPRAVSSFRKAGVHVIPAPTAFTNRPGRYGGRRLLDYLPQATALQISWMALHEYTGMLWYNISDTED